MGPKELIEEIRNAINNVKENFVSRQALYNYLCDLEKYVESSERHSKREADLLLENLKMAHERNMTHYKAQMDADLEMFRSLTTYAQVAIKSAFLINGGAAVALLTFIGNFSQNVSILTALTHSLIYFVVGVFLAAIGTIAAYLTQFYYSKNKLKIGSAWHISTFLVVIVSCFMFLLGTFEASKSFIPAG